MQPDLLHATLPCKVILFPESRRVGKIRHTAEMLSQKHGNAAAAYWRQVVNGLAAQLDRGGASPGERDSELRTFFDCVQAELVRMSDCGRKPEAMQHDQP
jgi:hypothetical protein